MSSSIIMCAWSFLVISPSTRSRWLGATFLASPNRPLTSRCCFFSSAVAFIRPPPDRSTRLWLDSWPSHPGPAGSHSGQGRTYLLRWWWGRRGGRRYRRALNSLSNSVTNHAPTEPRGGIQGYRRLTLVFRVAVVQGAQFLPNELAPAVSNSYTRWKRSR